MRHQTSHETLKNDLVINGCRICGARVSWSSGGFVHHVKYAHYGVTPQSYYVDEVLGFHPLCECGCSQRTEWQRRGGFYQRYVNGHNYRGKTKATDTTVATRTEKAKQHPNTKRSWFLDGHETWNDGLKLGDDPRWDEATQRACLTRNSRSQEEINSWKENISKTAKQNFALGLRVSCFTIATNEQRLEWADLASVTRTKNGFHSQRGFENGWHLSTKNGCKYHYESSWEHVRMELLDVDPTVMSWKKCDFNIPYWSSEGQKIKRYTPDFLVEYINGSILIEEVKGWMTEEVYDKAYAGMSYTLERGWNYKLTQKIKNTHTFVEIPLV